MARKAATKVAEKSAKTTAVKTTRPARTKNVPAVVANDVSAVAKKGSNIVLVNEYDMSYLLDLEFDAAAKKYEMIGGVNTLDRISSGCLVLDVLHGGGWAPLGICQMVGPEGSGKTTAITHTLGEALMQGIRSAINDAENTLSHELMLSSMGKDFDPTLMGRLRYHDQNILEPYFNFLRHVMRNMPDKVWHDDVGGFVYRFDKANKVQTNLLEAMGKGGVKADGKLSNRTHAILPANDSKPQMCVALDSWPALITDAADDREHGDSGGMSEKARKLAEMLPTITGRFRRKGVGLISANSLRERPGVLHGNPLYEAGGNVLRLSSVQRTWINTRVPEDKTWTRDKENGSLQVEANPLGGNDYYAWKGLTNVKNKTGQPFMKGWLRIWTNDPTGVGRGIDPVLDVWNYLKMTGQISGKRHLKFKVLLPKHSHMEPMTWMQFKLFVLAEKFGGRYAKTLKENGFDRIPRLRAECFSQIQSRKTVELLAAARLMRTVNSSDDLSDDE